MLNLNNDFFPKELAGFISLILKLKMPKSSFIKEMKATMTITLNKLLEWILAVF